MSGKDEASTFRNTAFAQTKPGALWEVIGDQVPARLCTLLEEEKRSHCNSSCKNHANGLIYVADTSHRMFDAGEFLQKEMGQVTTLRKLQDGMWARCW